MRKWPLLIGIALALASAPPAAAVIGTIDRVPAATLLIPYFEVDTSDPNGVTTLIAIQNTSASAMVAHVTLWTDLGIPTQGFDVYLTGYDQQTIDLREVFVGRRLPVTADAGADYADTFSPKGQFSQDINFPGCTDDPDDFGFGDDGPLWTLPPDVPAFTPAQGADLRAAHTGLASPTYFGAGTCGARPFADGIARGFVTVDTMTQIFACTNISPASPGYFTGIADERNILAGDYVIIDPGLGTMEAYGAVPIEASSTDPLTRTDLSTIKYTFYGRMPSVAGHGWDHREALPALWGATFAAGRSALRVWRDPGAGVGTFPCGGPLPAPYDLPQAGIVAYDTEGNPAVPLAGFPFPAAAGHTEVGAGGLPVPVSNGWLFLDLNLPAPSGLFGTARQSWVTVVRRPEAGEDLSVGWDGVQLGPVVQPSAP
jgi:hypothetical protein